MGADDEAEQIRAAVEELLPGTRLVLIRPLTGGRRHASWVLDTAVGPVVGKLVREPTATVTARLAEQRRVHHAGAAPVPRILAFSTETAALAPACSKVRCALCGAARRPPGRRST